MSSFYRRLTSNKLIFAISALVFVYLLLRVIALFQNQPATLSGNYFTWQDKQVRYVCSGQGTPYVFLETGFGSDAEVTWSSIVKELPTTFTTCYYDRLGHGGSDNVPTTFTTDEKSLLQESLIKHVAGEDPVIIVGKSYGGILARRTVARGNIKLSALVLLDSAHENQHAILDGKIGPISDSVKNLQYLNAAFGFTQIRNIFKTYDSPMAKRIDQFYAGFRWAHVLSTYRNEKGFYTPLNEFNYDFGELKLIVMSHDKEVYAENPRFAAIVDDWAEMQKSIAALSTNSEHIIVKGASHNMTADRPDAVINKIVETVAAVSEAS